MEAEDTRRRRERRRGSVYAWAAAHPSRVTSSSSSQARWRRRRGDPVVPPPPPCEPQLGPFHCFLDLPDAAIKHVVSFCDLRTVHRLRSQNRFLKDIADRDLEDCGPNLLPATLRMCGQEAVLRRGWSEAYATHDAIAVAALDRPWKAGYRCRQDGRVYDLGAARRLLRSKGSTSIDLFLLQGWKTVKCIVHYRNGFKTANRAAAKIRPILFSARGSAAEQLATSAFWERTLKPALLKADPSSIRYAFLGIHGTCPPPRRTWVLQFVTKNNDKVELEIDMAGQSV